MSVSHVRALTDLREELTAVAKPHSEVYVRGIPVALVNAQHTDGKTRMNNKS